MRLMPHQKVETHNLLLRHILDAATHAQDVPEKADVSYTLDSHLCEVVYGSKL
jgi:hypothetical protein